MSLRPVGLLTLAALTACVTQVGVAQSPSAAAGPLGSVTGRALERLSAAQPPEKPFTAFPDLRGPLTPSLLETIRDGKHEVIKNPDGTPVMVLDYEKLFAQMIGQFPRPIPKDAPALTKVRIAQVNEGMTYILKAKTQISICQFSASEFTACLNMIRETCQTAALVENDLARKRAAYEAQVILMWEVENFTKVQVETGNDRSQQLNRVRFYRLQAEAELLQFLAKK